MTDDRKELIDTLRSAAKRTETFDWVLGSAAYALAEADAEIERMKDDNSKNVHKVICDMTSMWAEQVRLAVLAEREACAKIADGGPYMVPSTDWSFEKRNDYGSGQIDESVSIAAAIRKRSTHDR